MSTSAKGEARNGRCPSMRCTHLVTLVSSWSNKARPIKSSGGSFAGLTSVRCALAAGSS